MNANYRHFEDAATAAGKRADAILRVMPTPIIVIDAEDRIVDANPAAEQILALSRAQLLGKSPLDPGWRAIRENGAPLRGEDHPAMVTLRTGQPLSGVVMGVETPEGDKRWIAEIIEANPLSVIVENARRALLWDEPLQWDRLAIITLFSLIIMQFGYYVFMRAKPQMADVH